MATVLEKDVIRESSEKSDNREIVVTLGENQKIELKLKGMKTGKVSIGILELWNKLNGKDATADEEKKDEPKKLKSIVQNAAKEHDNMMISLYDLRSQNAISTMSVQDVSKFDRILAELIDDQKRKKNAK